MIRPVGKHGPLWETGLQPPRFSRLGGDLEVDVAVIGAGITGLTTAWLLGRAGKRVAVLDLGQPGAGATGASSGHLTAVLDRRYAALAADFGEEGLRAAVRWSLEAIDFVERAVALLRADAGFERLPGWLYGERPEEELLRREAELARRAGLVATYTAEAPLPFPTSGAVRIERQAQIDPLRYAGALADAVADAGGLVFGHTRVEEIRDGEPVVVEAPPHTVRAREVVEATHTPLNLSLGIQTRVLPVLTFVTALRLDAPFPRGIFWDTESPYHYLRAAGGLLVAGGEDRRTGIEGDPALRLQALQDWVRARFAAGDVETSWSQQVFEPADGLPYIGRKPRSAHVYEAGGFAGNGLTFGTAAGLLISRLILGEEVPDAELVAPGRVKPIASARGFLRENLSVAWHLVADRLKSDEAAGQPPLLPQQGRVLQVDGHSAAVYRDARGDLHLLSPTCTHAGCLVRWNDVEKTWDCPCHGGRYDPLGRVLCSPPTKDLAPLSAPPIPSPGAVGPQTA